MLALKEIIKNLNQEVYRKIVEDLKKNKAYNFLTLFEWYKTEKKSDAELIKKLQISESSFYTLKSRLHHKIQNYCTDKIDVSREDVLNKLSNISDLCYRTPRAIANSTLLKLEKDLLHFDMHYELQIVYSALKKTNLHTGKYFLYSQLYNKQVAFGFSLEKSEEIMGEFSLLITQYYFSANSKLLDKMLFLREELVNLFNLNSAKQILIIKNLIDIQILIFCKTDLNAKLSVVELLNETSILLDGLPANAYKKYKLVLNYLYFEYYFSLSQIKQAETYFVKVNEELSHLLLYSGIGNVSRFLFSKLDFCLTNVDYRNNIHVDSALFILYDDKDMFSEISVEIYRAMCFYYTNEIVKASDKLNDILTKHVLKDYNFIVLKLKILQILFLLKQNNAIEANRILFNIQRKVKSDKLDGQYPQITYLFKFFKIDFNNKGKRNGDRGRELLILFEAKNKLNGNILTFIVPELYNFLNDKK